jgi:hypothetical protein
MRTRRLTARLPRAELAVRLVNTSSLGYEGGGLLTSMDGLRALVAGREHLNHSITRADLDSLRMLLNEFRGFFPACSQGNGAEAADRLNELLIQYPVHPSSPAMTGSRGTCATPKAARRPISTPPGRPWALRSG